MVRRAVNGGPGAARNTGLAAADTPLVAFLDSDYGTSGAVLEQRHLGDGAPALRVGLATASGSGRAAPDGETSGRCCPG